jgi:hypothetical protein
VISFGLVAVPVGLFTATEEHQPHHFAAGGSDRVRYKRVNERTGEEVDYADISGRAPATTARKAPAKKITTAGTTTAARKVPARKAVASDNAPVKRTRAKKATRKAS